MTDEQRLQEARALLEHTMGKESTRLDSDVTNEDRVMFLMSAHQTASSAPSVLSSRSIILGILLSVHSPTLAGALLERMSTRIGKAFAGIEEDAKQAGALYQAFCEKYPS